MNIFFKTGLLLIFILCPVEIFSRSEEFYQEGWAFKIGGYYKNIFMYEDRNSFYSDVCSFPVKKELISDVNRLRISPEHTFKDSFIFNADIDLETVSTNYYGTNEFDARWRESEYNDIIKPSREIADNNRIYGRAEFQNIYIKMSAGQFTGTAGRQQVRFGSSRLWNPLDLMNPISPLLVEGAGEQKGTDAVRLDWFPGDTMELTGVFSPRRENDRCHKMEPESGNYIARFKGGVNKTDIALLAGYTSKRKNLGTDFTAVIYNGLLTGVVLYSIPDKGDKYFQCGSGYEYTFSSGVYILAEYFYSSSPVSEDGELSTAIYHNSIYGIDESNCYILSNRMITYNSHYFSVATGYNIFSLLRGELFSIYDFQGSGLFLNVSLKLNAMENLDLTSGLTVAYVHDSTKVSDFDIYNKQPVFYASIQLYF